MGLELGSSPQLVMVVEVVVTDSETEVVVVEERYGLRHWIAQFEQAQVEVVHQAIGEVRREIELHLSLCLYLHDF